MRSKGGCTAMVKDGLKPDRHLKNNSKMDISVDMISVLVAFVFKPRNGLPCSTALKRDHIRDDLPLPPGPCRRTILDFSGIRPSHIKSGATIVEPRF